MKLIARNREVEKEPLGRGGDPQKGSGSNEEDGDPERTSGWKRIERIKSGKKEKVPPRRSGSAARFPVNIR